MNTQKRIALIACLVSLFAGIAGCGSSHAQKKQAMVQQWEQSTASAQLPAIETLLEQGDIERAKEQLADCIQSNPELPEAFVLVGRIHFLESQNEQAREAFETAVEMDPQLDQAWNFLGSLAVLEKDFDRAIECYQRATDLAPSKTDYTVSLADIYVETGQIFRALSFLNKQISRQPNNLELLLSKAHLYQRNEQTDEAIQIYEQAQIMHGDLPQILESAGYAHIAQENWKQAAGKFERLLGQYETTDERYFVTMRALARCLFNSEQYASALFWYDKLSVVYRDDADIWLDMGQAALGLNDPKRAAYCANNAIQAKPSWPKAYAVLGSAHYMQGRYTPSLEAFYKITDDDELAGFAWFMSGRCYQQLGRNRQANIAFERAEKLDPDNKLIAAFLNKTVHPL